MAANPFNASLLLNSDIPSSVSIYLAKTSSPLPRNPIEIPEIPANEKRNMLK